MSNKLLVTLATENYLNQAKQLFASVYFNAGWNGDMMLLAHEIPEEKLAWFKEKNILVKNCHPIEAKRLNGKWPIVVLDKFYLFTPEFKKWDNVIFLDADIIVRNNIDLLASIKGLGAITGHRHFSNLWLNRLHIFLEKLDYQPIKDLRREFDFKTKSFNTGVIAFSTDIIKDDTFNNLITLSQKYFGVSASGEEAILNIYFYKQWKELSELYNFYPDCVIPEAGIKPTEVQAYILHFIINKPWNTRSSFYLEWKNNLNMAEKIGTKIDNAPQAIELVSYLESIKKRRAKRFLVKYYNDFILDFDKTIGLLGLLIKFLSPSTYKHIKKIKDYAINK